MLTYSTDMQLTLADIEAMDPAQATVLLVQVEEAAAGLPPVKRRPHIKDQTRGPDVRTAFEDPYVYERIYLQMVLSDLRARVMHPGPAPLLLHGDQDPGRFPAADLSRS